MVFEWKESLERLQAAIAADTERVDDAARLARPAARASYLTKLRKAKAALVVSETSTSLTDLIALEAVQQLLADVAADARSVSVREATDHGMSRSFAETTRQIATDVDTAESLAATMMNSVRPLARAAGAASPAAAQAAYRTQPASELATEALVGASGDANGDGSKEALLNLTAGVADDTAAKIAKARADRLGMHPLQALEVTFGMSPAAGERSGGESTLLNQTVPGATRAVRYNIDALLDAGAARASTVTGLNYRLTQRLRTVWETRVATEPAELGRLAEPADACGGGVARTVDQGLSYQTMAATWDTDDGALACALRAGPRPRVEQLGRLLELAVLRPPSRQSEGVRVHDPARLLEAYSATAVDAEDELVANMLRDLRREFGKVAESAAPKTHDSFMEALLGGAEPSYMAEVVGRHLRQHTEEQIAGQTAHTVSTRAAARERMLTGQVQAAATVQAVRTKLRHAAAGIATARALRTSTAAQLGGRIYNAAFAPRGRDDHRVDKLAAVGPQPSLKLYLLRHSDAGQS